MTTATLTSPDLPMLLEELEVTRVERLSPSFVRVELASPALAELGFEGTRYDQRIKLVFPGRSGLSSFAGADEGWMRAWFERPADERGHMRTYTVRDVLGEGPDTRLVVDFVLHGEGDGSGPGGEWGAHAAVGDRIVTLAPRRGFPFGGIEFAPGDATHLLLVGDETALPAIATILEQLPPDARGAVYVEVPLADDVLPLRGPAGMAVTWLPRDGGERGAELHPAVLAHLGAEPAALVLPAADEVDPDLWETPTHSSSGEEVDAPVRTLGHDHDGLYAWIAGESAVVTALRRALVKDLGIDRHQVSFMGYWRRGVAMRS